MFQLRMPSRPVRYAIVAAHTFREALEELSVDDKIEQLASKVADLEAKLEALDDSIDETPVDPKPKAKRDHEPRRRSDSMNDKVPNDWLEKLILVITGFGVIGAMYALLYLSQQAQMQ